MLANGSKRKQKEAKGSKYKQNFANCSTKHQNSHTMRKSFLMYADGYETLKHLSDEQLGRLLRMLFEYFNNNVNCDVSDPLFFVFTPLRVQMDRDREKYEGICKRRAEAGKRGGEANASKSKQMVAKGSKRKQVQQDIDKDRDKEINIIVSSPNVEETKKYPKGYQKGSPQGGSLPSLPAALPEDNPAEQSLPEKLGAPAEPKPGKTVSFRSWDKKQLAEAIAPYVARYGKDLCKEFHAYWSEPTPNGRIRVNLEPAFDLSRRLQTWAGNSSKFNRGKSTHSAPPPQHFTSKEAAEQYVLETYFQGRKDKSPISMGIAITDQNNQPRPIDEINRDVERYMKQISSQ